MGKGLQRTVLTVLFLVGLAIFSYPYAQVFRVKREMESTVQFFQEQKETQPTTSVMIPDVVSGCSDAGRGKDAGGCRADGVPPHPAKRQG